MTTSDGRHVGFVTTNNVDQLLDADAKAREAEALLSAEIDKTSAAVRRAAAAVVTATSDESRARAEQRLSVLSVTDALNAQATAAGLAAKAMVDSAQAEAAALSAPLEAMRAQQAEWESAQAAEAASTEALRAKVIASFAEMDAAVDANVKAQEDAAVKTDAAQAASSRGVAGGAAAIGGSAAGGVALAGAAALTVVGAESVKAASQFQQTTELFRTQAGQSQAAVASLGQGILQLSQQVAYGPNSLSNAMYAVVSAGYAGSDALDIQKQAALGARVGNADLTQTTDALVATMKALNVPGADAGKVMGQLNAIVGSGKLTMDQLNAALATGVVPAVQVAGVSLQSLGAALSYMTDRGIPADQAAQKLRATVALLTSPSGEAAKALSAIGLAGPNVTAATQQMADALSKAHVTTTQLTDDLKKPDGIQVALTQLDAAFKTAGVSSDTAAAVIGKAFGGGKSDQAVLDLISNLEGVKQKYIQLGQTANDFGADVTATQSTQAYQDAQLKASLQALEVELGEKLLPKLQEIVTWVNSHWTEISATASRVFHDAEQSVGDFDKFVYTAFRQIDDVILDVFNGVVRAAADVAEALHLPFQDGLNAASQDLTNFHTTIDNTFTQISNEAATWGHDTGTNFGTNLVASVSVAVNAARSLVNSSMLANAGQKNTLGGVGSTPYGPGMQAAGPGQLNANGGVGSAAYGPSVADAAAAAAAAAAGAPTTGLSGLGAGTGTYSAPPSGTARVKAVDEMAQSISDLRAQETQLAISTILAKTAGLDQQQQALSSANSLVQQAQATALAAKGTKDYHAAVTALAVAQREQITLAKMVDSSGLAKITAAQTALSGRSNDAPQNGTGVAGAQATLSFDNATTRATQSLIAQTEAYVKAKHSAADHAAAVKTLADEQQALNQAQAKGVSDQLALIAAQQQARQDAVDLMNAMSAATVVGATPLVQANEKLAEAQRQLGIDAQGTTQWFKDQAAVLQDVLDVATAASSAVAQAQQDSVDLANAQLEAAADPGNAAQQAQNKVTEAMNQLAIDAQGTTKWYTDQAALNQATYAQTQAALSATTALNSLADASQIVTNLPSYLATVQATSSSYVQPGYINGGGGGSMTHNVNVTVSGLVTGSPDEVAQALTPSIRAALNTTQRRAGQPLLAG